MNKNNFFIINYCALLLFFAQHGKAQKMNKKDFMLESVALHDDWRGTHVMCKTNKETLLMMNEASLKCKHPS